MSEKLTPTTDSALEEVRIQFETWREAKKGNDRIPESLWQPAVDLTKTYSLNKIAKALGLNHTRLKIRVNASEAALAINKEASGAMDPALEAVRLQFENWREGKGANERIPEELWEAAINLAETLSLGKISETLRLSYTRLKNGWRPRQPFVPWRRSQPQPRIPPSRRFIPNSKPGVAPKKAANGFQRIYGKPPWISQGRFPSAP